MEWHTVEWRNSERITDTVMFLSARRLPSPPYIAKNVHVPKERSARSPERITSVSNDLRNVGAILHRVTNLVRIVVMYLIARNSRNSLVLNLIRSPCDDIFIRDDIALRYFTGTSIRYVIYFTRNAANQFGKVTYIQIYNLKVIIIKSNCLNADKAITFFKYSQNLLLSQI